MRLASTLACLLLTACALPWIPQEREPVPQPVHRPPPGTRSPAAPSDAHDAQSAITIAIGATHWDELGSLSTAGTGWTPEQFGSFDRWGMSLDFGFEHVVGRIRGRPWSLGLEFGIGSFANEGSGTSRFSNRLEALLTRITPTARVQIPLTDGVAFVPGVGVGAYWLSFDEYDQDIWGESYRSNGLYDEWAFGGFVDLALDIAVSDSGSAIRIDNEFHWVEFDGVDAVLPTVDGVGGLVYAVQIGFVQRF